jgi:DNA-directed RNA polymerase omega subunit
MVLVETEPEIKETTVPEEEPKLKTKEPTQFLAEDFEGQADNIYEAIIVIARRARQIGENQKKEIDRTIGTIDLSESPIETQPPPEEEPVEPEFVHYEKPTILSMQEVKKGLVKFNYKK